MECYLVQGCVETGAGGGDFIVGLFSTEEAARQAIVRFIGDQHYDEYDKNRFEVDDRTRRIHYQIQIPPYTLDAYRGPDVVFK